MPVHPNILFLMTDQMQGRVLRPDHPCQTPNLDRLLERAVRFDSAYTTSAVSSPARASLMTGLLPHNHGVLHVTHTVDADQSVLRQDKPHWAQKLRDAGYRTGYFGKWHVEASADLDRYGWSTSAEGRSPQMAEYRRQTLGDDPPPEKLSVVKHLANIPGYPPGWLYGVTDRPPEDREMGLVCGLAKHWLNETIGQERPWCCFVSVPEPHDPFVAHEAFYQLYGVDEIDAPPNWEDPLTDRPGLYRKAQRPFSGLTLEEKKQAAACYWARVSEVDEQFGELLRLLDERGARDNTIVVLASDHGEMLGAHGLYFKNFGAFEEAYNVPLVIAGPDVAHGVTTNARVGLHDVGPTLLELAGIEPLVTTDARSFLRVLQNPATENEFTTGYAEYHGSRYCLTQRIVWNGAWKYVHNGFDEDELYNLDDDPYELRNRRDDPSAQDALRDAVRLMWKTIRDTGDRTLLHTAYPAVRLAPYGPHIAE